jgi:hypothetical protein
MATPSRTELVDRKDRGRRCTQSRLAGGGAPPLTGPKDDVVPHTRFRRVGVHKWQIEMPLMGGGWDRTSLRGQLVESVDLVVTQFPWMLAARQ